MSPKKDRGKLFSNKTEKVRVSKYIAWLLRHNPEGLDMDNQGRVLLTSLVDRLQRKWPGITQRHIENIVDTSGKTKTKKRFAIEDNRIYATYGHSLKNIQTDSSAQEE